MCETPEKKERLDKSGEGRNEWKDGTDLKILDIILYIYRYIYTEKKTKTTGWRYATQNTQDEEKMKKSDASDGGTGPKTNKSI